jgi:hypothetical protein
VENNSTRIYSIPFSLQPPNLISTTKVDPEQIDSNTSTSTISQIDHCSSHAQVVYPDLPLSHDCSQPSNPSQFNQQINQRSKKKTNSISDLYSDRVTEQIAISALNQLKQK